MISKNDLFGCVNRWRSGDIYTLASFCRLPRVCLGREPSSGRLSAFRPADIGTRQISRRRFLSLFFFLALERVPVFLAAISDSVEKHQKGDFLYGDPLDPISSFRLTKSTAFLGPARVPSWLGGGYFARAASFPRISIAFVDLSPWERQILRFWPIWGRSWRSWHRLAFFLGE